MANACDNLLFGRSHNARHIAGESREMEARSGLNLVEVSAILDEG